MTNWKIFILGIILLPGLSISFAQSTSEPGIYLVVLGNVQDAGSPQLGCTKICCASLTPREADRRMVSCLAVYDEQDSSYFLLDASPDIARQIQLLNEVRGETRSLPDAIFLTHAHIGHYTGLLYLGREAAGTHEMPVYAMPRMKRFLQANGPWSMLDSSAYIELRDLYEDQPVAFNQRLSITPLLVPHRDEFSETVGFLVETARSRVLYIPDIDKWHEWEKDIRLLVQDCDYAFIDGTFYDGNELPGRDMSEIPHPFIAESTQLFNELPHDVRSGIYFTHLNHTNPLLNENSAETKALLDSGFMIARTGMMFRLD